MWKLFGNKEPLRLRLPRRRIVYTPLFLVGILLVLTASQHLFTDEREYSAARSEYDELRERYPVMSVYLPPASHPLSFDNPKDAILRTAIPNYISTETITSDSPEAEYPDPLSELYDLNPDFVGWIAIEGLIDYPVVRGYDNSFYLDKTFTGNYNSSGTIFMDNRNARGFDSPVSILYGHNMKDGSMFAPLHLYYDKTFMAEHPYIAVVTLAGELLLYKVFSARYTNVQDRAYLLGFSDGKDAAKAFQGAPGDASRFLLLSTCTNTENHDERLLIFASLVN